MKFFKTTKGIRKREPRPTGTLPKENLLEEMTQNVEEYVEYLSAKPDVVGITLTGGMSRGYGDSLSEIDLNVYIIEKKLKDWKMGKGPIPHGDHMGTRYHMDVSFLSLEEEKKEKWSLLKKWDASYTKILYDPTGKIEKLLDLKDVFTAEEKHSIALSNYLDCVYFGDIVVRQWTQRKDPMVANQMISKGIPALCNLLFLANDEYLPFEKWIVNYTYSLEWKPKLWRKRLSKITTIREPSFNEVQQRSKEFMRLYREVWGRVVGEEYKKTGLLELDALETLEFVIREEPTVEEFKKKYSLNQLGYENLYKLADIKKIDGEEKIIFNHTKFRKEKESGFPSFLDWNKEMLEHINP